MTNAPGAVERLPLTLPRAVSTFGLAVIGLLTANVLPFMIIALQEALGTGATEAGAVMTGSLLATALTCLAVTRLAEGRRRTLVARVGLAVTVVGYGVAALGLGPALTIAGVIVGGAGAGGAVASSGAALAALRNPNRISAVSGLVNRGIVTVVLAVIPLLGITLGSAFGLVAGMALAVLFVSHWLPAAPLAAFDDAERPAVAAAAAPSRALTAAGIGILALFALWAVGEDSLWALAGAMGADQAGLDDAGLGFVLSASTAGGLLASIVLIFIGDRLGRAVPLLVLLVLGGGLKLAASLATDPTVLTIVLIAWNTVYLAVFLLFIATAAALDANGRWSGPCLGVYLIGSSFAPIVGAWLAETFGYAGFGWTIAIISWAIAVPVVLIARLSSRIERRERAAAEAVPDAGAHTLEAGRP
ncbi:MFS transporter [Herbiconiux sp. SYSU D00978]|uniref:MFS transporter n=1 Tax=Herbiconiux sp. SYSU D00978 TaxID=2812562 RepID=UPI001A96F7CD|nr:MFS transporter [Herbiconiux sp. SYSU D00978]